MNEICVCGCPWNAHQKIRLSEPIKAHDPVWYPLPGFATTRTYIGYTPPKANYYIDECECGNCFEYHPDKGTDE